MAIIGIITMAVAVIIGGTAGTLLKGRISQRAKEKIMFYIGLACTGGAIATIVAGKTPGPIAGAIIIGSIIGEVINLEGKINWLLGKLENFLSTKVFPLPKGDDYAERREMLLVVAIILCASGNGIYGAMMEGFNGDTMPLFIKTFLDLFCSMLFASTLGYIVITLAVPQFVIYLAFFFLARLIVPICSDVMLADFKACGGVIMFATGIHVMGLKKVSLGNMLPALAIVMPLSWLWNLLF